MSYYYGKFTDWVSRLVPNEITCKCCGHNRSGINWYSQDAPIHKDTICRLCYEKHVLKKTDTDTDTDTGSCKGDAELWKNRHEILEFVNVGLMVERSEMDNRRCEAMELVEVWREKCHELESEFIAMREDRDMFKKKAEAVE